MKITRFQEAPDLPEWLRSAAQQSGKTTVKICWDAEICTQVWYALLKGQRKVVSEELLQRLESALGQTYRAPQ